MDFDDEGGQMSPAHSSKKSSKSKKGKDDFEADHEDDEFFKKWSGPVLIGPIVPAVFALIVIVSGQLVLNTWEGSCGYALDSFISAAIAMCYLFLLIFSWVYMGDTIRIVLPSLGVDFVLLSPFKSLKFISLMYFILAVVTFIVWIVGSVLLQLSVFCEATAPTLYKYSTFLVATYWLGFVITCLVMTKFFFGSNIAKMIKETTRASTIDEVEERLFRSKFDVYDVEKENRIPADKVPLVLEDLGVFVPPEEMDALIQTLDEEETGYVEFRPLLQWFRKLNAEMDAQEADRGLDDDEDADDAQDREAAEMFTKRR